MIFGENPKVYHCLYSSTEQLQVALWTYMLLNIGLNNDKCIQTLPLLSVPFHISPSLSLPLQTLRLVSLVSLIAKSKRIAERSDTNCDTHTQSHTDRQSTLDKYMIDRFCKYNSHLTGDYLYLLRHDLGCWSIILLKVCRKCIFICTVYNYTPESFVKSGFKSAK